jgi:cation-transporting P-type ATPase E
MSAIILVAAVFEGLPNVRLVQIAAVLSGQVPYGLFLMIAVATTATIIVAVTMIGLDFPFDPAQTALTTFTVGIPAFFLTLWARPRRLAEGLLPSLARFVVPVAMLTTLMGVGIYAIDYDIVLGAVDGAPELADDVPDEFRETYESYTGVTFGSEGYENIVATVTAQGSLSIFVSWTAVLLILFLEPPHRFFLGWRKEVSQDRRPAVLAAALFVVLLAVWSVDPIGYYFGVLTKPEEVTATIMGAVAVWFFLIRTIWRANLLDRLLGLDGGE